MLIAGETGNEHYLNCVTQKKLLRLNRRVKIFGKKLDRFHNATIDIIKYAIMDPSFGWCYIPDLPDVPAGTFQRRTFVTLTLTKTNIAQTIRTFSNLKQYAPCVATLHMGRPNSNKHTIPKLCFRTASI